MASIYQRMKSRLTSTKDSFKDKLNHAMYYHELDDDFLKSWRKA